ncbi:hypothetical protein K1T71_007804 [Dendrolimus kikuchii]|uniref:Uncharacterized protein n=1 Tax=Dendrolimus kikuchii TaxID=765133 RepID=A0ACC1CYC1_9NEOP|nr:hypothetical protein K1T71_007804 [Dendrolimus kikuchii]
MELSSGTKQFIQLILADWKLILFLTTLFGVYFYYTSTFDFFKKKGISYIKPVIFLGNLGPRLTSKISFHEFQLQNYNHFKGQRYGGTFDGRKPVLTILDVDLIKAIMIRDFDHFTDRSTLSGKEAAYIQRSLLNLKGSEWKSVRSTLTPVFSSAKLRHMLPLVQECSQQLVNFLEHYDGKDAEMKQTIGHFTLEVIGECAFGVKCDALTDKNSHFLKVAEKFDYMTKAKRVLVLCSMMLMPELFRLLKVSFLNLESTDELVRILQATKLERRSGKSKRNDFLQLLIDFANTQKNDAGDIKELKHLDDDTIDAQCLLFLIAGYETSSTLLSFAIYTMATRPDLQEKLRVHVIEVTHGKEIDYELLSQLTYLEAFLLETLRMYPPVARVDRTCTKPYTLPNSSVHLDVGDVVSIPIYGIHMDADHYPEPHEFRAERFIGDEKKERPSHLFLPFGAGPRNCIGLRFAMISAKLAMVALLKNYRFSTSPKTENPITFHKRAIFLKPQSGLWIHVEKLKQ